MSDFHPLAEEYPLMPESELIILAEGMRTKGYNPLYPIVLFEGLVLDGRNRFLAAGRAGVEPTFTQLPPGEDPVEYVRQANEHRRHLSQEWLQKRRQERVARVLNGRQQGKSLRTLAEEERVDEKQIRDDLTVGVSGADRSAPDTPGVKGRDGKIYPSSRSSSPPSAPKPTVPLQREEEQEDELPFADPGSKAPKAPPPPLAPKYPHSDRLVQWLRVVTGETIYIENELGGIQKLLGEPEKWNLADVRQYILPMLEAHASTVSRYLQEIESHAASTRNG